MTEAEKERAAIVADILYAAAREFYGQGFKTDRQYWLHLGKAVCDHRDADRTGRHPATGE